MSRPSAVGVHCYAGGFAVGVSRHFDVVAHFEELDAGLGVFRDNFPKAELTHSEPKGWPTKRYRGVDLVYGNPPCAPWSQSAGNTRKGLGDPRVAYTFDTAAAALALRPKVFVLESVSKILRYGAPVLEELTARSHGAGYAVTYFLTNAVLHGVAQYRERFHFVAHKTPFYPPARLGDYGEALTVRDAIGDLEGVEPDGGVDGHNYYEPPEKALGPLLGYMLQGEDGWRMHQRAVDDGLAERASLSMLYKRPRYDCPSNAVVAVDRLVHPTLPRMITVREAARLCSYPDDFTFRESGRRWAHDPGQAVCPNVAECVAESAAEGIASGEEIADVRRESSKEPDNVIDYRDKGREFHKLFLRDFKAMRKGREASPFMGVR